MSVTVLGLFILGAAFGLAGLFRPSLGLLFFLVLHFVQPGELFPALEPLRLELVYGACLGIVILLKRSQDSTPLLSDRILRGLLVLIGVAALSVPLSVWPGGAFNQLIDLAKLVCIVFFIRMLIETNGKLRALLWFLALLLAWFAGSGLVAYFQGDYYLLKQGDSPEDLARAMGINSVVGGPNELSGLIVALLPFLVTLFRCTRSIFARMLLLAIGCVGLAAAVLTGSRTGILAAAGLALYYVACSKHKVISFTLLITLAMATWLAMPQRYRERYLSVERYAEGSKLDPSNQYRLQIWKAGVRMFVDHPLLGVGAGQFPTAYGLTYGGRKHGGWMNPHNLLIQVGTELGGIGMVAFAFLVVQIIKSNRSVLLLEGREGLELNCQLAVACSAMLLGVVVLSCVGHTLYRPYWYLLAAFVSANHGLTLSWLQRQPQESTEVADAPGGAAELVQPTALYWRTDAGEWV